MPDIKVELEAARMKLDEAQGGLGEYMHMRNAIWALDDKYRVTWNDWMDRMLVGCLEETQFTIMMAGSGAGKSHFMALYGMMWWWQSPNDRLLLAGTTSLAASDMRVWGYIVDIYKKGIHPDNPWLGLGGKIYQDDRRIHPVVRQKNIAHADINNRFGVKAVAIPSVYREGAEKNLIGGHPEGGLMVLLDELTDLGEMAILKAIPNWLQNTFFKGIGAGNPKLPGDTMHKMAEPLGVGWDSVELGRDKEWEGKYGNVLHFDCYDSPYYKNPERKELAFLIGGKVLEDAIRIYGVENPEFKRMYRGWYVENTMDHEGITPQIIAKHKAQEKGFWEGQPRTLIGALDPTFSTSKNANDCVLRFAWMGHDSSGREVLDFCHEEFIYRLKLVNHPSDPTEYQIKRQLVSICDSLGVPPKHVIVDSQGIGHGLGSILKKEWSPMFYEVCTKGHASEEVIDHKHNIRAKDIYDRKSTEVWMEMKRFIESGQIKGLCDTTSKELCGRLVDTSKNKIRVETKKELNIRIGLNFSKAFSPDYADTACYVLELAKKLGFKHDSRPLDPSNIYQEKRKIRRRSAGNRRINFKGDPFQTESQLVFNGNPFNI